MSLDWSILYWIQSNTVCDLFDLLMPKLTLLGSGGAIWLPKTTPGLLVRRLSLRKNGAVSAPFQAVCRCLLDGYSDVPV